MRKGGYDDFYNTSTGMMGEVVDGEGDEDVVEQWIDAVESVGREGWMDVFKRPRQRVRAGERVSRWQN